MGMYDERCMVTGVSLKVSRTVLVLLQKSGETHRPISLGIEGKYNRYGSIDGVNDDVNTESILRYFNSQITTGRFVVDEEYLRIHRAYPFERIEQLLTAFERNINDDPRAAVLDDEPVTFALIDRTIWKVITFHEQELRRSCSRLFAGLFEQNVIAKSIYPNLSNDLDEQVTELFLMQKFLVEQRIPWVRADDSSQHYSEEKQDYLIEARSRFRDHDLIQYALDRYQDLIEESLEDEE